MIQRSTESLGTTLAYGSVTSGSVNVPQPRDPGVRDKALEILGFLSELDQVQYAMREKLYGPGPTQAPGLQPPPANRAIEPSIDELLGIAASQVACAVGEARSILQRL